MADNERQIVDITNLPLKKAELEKTIKEAIAKFEEEYGLYVRYVCVEHTDEDTYPSNYDGALTDVRVDAVIRGNSIT